MDLTAQLRSGAIYAGVGSGNGLPPTRLVPRRRPRTTRRQPAAIPTRSAQLPLLRLLPLSGSRLASIAACPEPAQTPRTWLVTCLAPGRS